MENRKSNIHDLDLPELQAQMAAWEEPVFRSRQIWQGLYQSLWQSPDEYSTLPAKLREKLDQNFTLNPLSLIDSFKSKDKETIKLLFGLQDGNMIETVIMGYDERNTACISTQSGCAMGCDFCATGQMGFYRNLTSGEIIAQVIYLMRMLRQQEEKLTNIVFMGMGEPFHNYNAVLAAVDRMNNADGLNIGERRFTISTVGIIPGIQRFTTEKRQVNLAVSLHAANNELRSRMMPVNQKFPLEPLIEACREYVRRTNRRITFEWALIQSVNDNPTDAQELVRLIKGLLCHVNLIQLNPTSRFQGKGSSRDRANAFRQVLVDAGIPCTIRVRRGIDIKAGCGQLASQHLKPPA